MGHVYTQVTITNPVDATASLQVEAMVDTGATFTVVPRSLANQLKLPVVGKSGVRTASGEMTLERVTASIKINGQSDVHSVLISDVLDKVLIGVITLEGLSLTIDPTSGELRQAEA